MLFNLSVKNFRKSIKDYSIYFFTIILGIMVFYVFNAIETQTAMMEVTKTTAAIVHTMNGVLDGVSILVSFILGYLIVYASQFMLKRRKKEFGIYLILGMSRVQVAQILWLETIWIGLISLGAGLAAGIGLSQLMSLVVANLFQADVSDFVFVISGKAIAKSIVYFLIIYLVVMILNTFSVGKSRLIDFMTAGKKKERNLLRAPVLYVCVFLAAIGMLGFAYYNVTANQQALQSEKAVFFQVFFGIAGTFLFFWFLSGFFMSGIGKMKRIYYKKLNSFVVGEISNKLNTAVAACSIICLLIFITICMLFSGVARKSYKEKEAQKLAPVSISMEKDMEGETDDIEAVLDKREVPRSYFKDMISVNVYGLEDVTHRKVLGSWLEENMRFYGEEYAQAKVPVMYISEYNKVAKRYGNKEYQLGENQYLIVADMEGAVEIFNQGLAANKELSIKGKTYHAKVDTCQSGYLFMNYEPGNQGVILLPDSVELTDQEIYRNYVLADYTDHGKEFREKIDTKFFDYLNPKDADYEPVYMNTQSAIYDDTIGTSAMFIFLGLYLGICFLISGSAVLALKILSDVVDSREKYLILRKLGCEEREIRKALWKQNSIFFLLPLLLAVVHSIFGVQVCMELLSIYNTEGMVSSLFITGGLILGIYGGYFVLSQICCEKIVKE